MEVRADISAREFWCRGQRAFFDVKIFYPNAQRDEKTLNKCYENNEPEKKRDYNSRVFNVEQGYVLHSRWNERRKFDVCQMFMSVNCNKTKRKFKCCYGRNSVQNQL